MKPLWVQPSLFYSSFLIVNRFTDPTRCVDTAKKFKVTIEEDKCKGCLICVHVCEQRGGKILKPSDKKTALGGVKPVPDGECIGCRWCERYCPDFAIYVEEMQDA